MPCPLGCVAADSVDQSEVDGKSPDSYYAFTIHTVSKLDSLERANLNVGGVSLRAIIDTGADCNVISMQDWQKFKQAEVKITKSERCDNYVCIFLCLKNPTHVYWSVLGRCGLM